MDDASSTWRLYAAAGLIFLNACLVAAGFAIVKARPTRLRELAESGSRRASTALRITSRLDAYLSASQFGTTLSTFTLGWIIGPEMRRLLAPWFFSAMPNSGALATVVAGVLGFAVMTFLHALLGELIPKTVGIHRADSIALWTAVPLHAWYVISYPALWVLNAAQDIVLRRLGIQVAEGTSNVVHSEEEIRLIVSTSQEQGILEEHEAELVDNIFDYTDRVAREIMTPRNDVSVLFTDQSLEEATQFVLDEGYTRYPLCQGERDHVIGVVHIRDIFAVRCSGQEKTLEEIARQPLIIPETLPLNQAQRKFQDSGTHISLVVDEYGAFSGIVTLEDLVEEVFGEFRDEFDDQEPEMILTTDDGFEMDAGMLIEEAMEVLGVEDEIEVEGVDTVGGLVFSMLGERPEIGDTVTIDGYQLEVVAVEGLRITRVKAVATGEGSGMESQTDSAGLAVS